MNRLAIAVITLAVLLAGAFWAGWEWRDRSADIKKLRADLELAELVNDTLVEAIDSERAKARALADIGTQHEEDRREAETVPAAVAADLRAGNLRLQQRWAGCETQRLSDSAAAASELDAAARDREESAGRIVRAAAQCDAQVRGLQELLILEREQLNKR